MEYMGPEPGKGTHRYALLMFEQPSFQQITPPTKRAYFQTKHVSMAGRLCVWGGGTVWQAQRSVGVLHCGAASCRMRDSLLWADRRLRFMEKSNAQNAQVFT